MLKLILSSVLLVIAFVFTYIFPGSGVEGTIISVVGALIGTTGVVDWRKKYDDSKAWFKSKTIVGALTVLIPLLIVIFLPALAVYFKFVPAQWIYELLNTIVVIGGGSTIAGIFDIKK